MNYFHFLHVCQFSCIRYICINGQNHLGIKGVSPLLVDCSDLVHGLLPDYMHGIVLRLSKALLKLLLSSVNSGQPYSVGNVFKMIDSRLQHMQPRDDIQHLPMYMVLSPTYHVTPSEKDFVMIIYNVLQ